MLDTQSNTRAGVLAIVSDGDLTGKEGRLVTLGADGVKLPAAITDRVPYVIDDGAGDELPTAVLPLESGRQVRIRAKGTGSRGDVLTLAAIAGDDAGKVRALPAANGTYHAVGIAEEDFADGQLVLVRPIAREAIVVS